MNFSKQFLDNWNSRFPDFAQVPHLECLKADQFSSLIEQKQAIEFEESKRCAIIDELKQQLEHEAFVSDFLHKCIQRLSAISQVFSELDQSDSKSNSSSGTIGRHPISSVSPNSSINGSPSAHNKFLPPSSGSTFPLFPQCIASSLIHSASPLLAAAAATSNAPFLLTSSLPPFPCAESMKLDPEPENLHSRSSNFLLSATERSSYDALSRLTAPSTLYNNPFTSGSQFSSAFSSHHLRPQASPFDADGPNKVEPSILCPETCSASACEAQAAAAAVAAAFGLGFPTVRSGSHSSNSLLAQSNQAPSHGKLDNPGVGGNMNTIHQVPSLRPSHMTIEMEDHKGTMLDTSSDRPYQCSTCSRSFAVKAGLVQHMRTHTDERPYPCNHCGRAFKQKIQLTTHMRVHSGERPYGCRLCGKLFRQQSHVVQHLRTHTGEKPHKCYQCGKAFRQKYSLISHQRRMCRNRSASNPIAAGMTMWISPGAGGNTCNLVKEFSPAKSAAPVPPTLSSPHASVSAPTSVNTSVQSPFSPYLASPPIATTPTSLSQSAQFHSPIDQQSLDESPCENRSLSSHIPFNNTSISRQTAFRHRLDSTVPLENHVSLTSDEDDAICSTRISNTQQATALGLG